MGSLRYDVHITPDIGLDHAFATFRDALAFAALLSGNEVEIEITDRDEDGHAIWRSAPTKEKRS